MEKPIISVHGIGKKYFIGKPNLKVQKKQSSPRTFSPFRLFRGMGMPFSSPSEKEFWALKDISFDLDFGERLGIIGRNGAGKTTLLKILSRLVAPTEGEARIRGRVTSLLGVGTGFNGNMTGRENVYLESTLHGLTRAEIDRKFDEIVEFSGVGKFIDTPVKYYSSGMYSRLAFSVAAHLEPDILMLDEVLAVGDIAFQQKCLNKVQGLATSGRTIIFVSHSMENIVKFCNKVIWLEEGRMVEYGDTKDVVASYSRRMLALRSTFTAPGTSISPQDTEKKRENEHPDAKAAELISIEITDIEGNPKEIFFRNEPLKIKTKFRALVDHVPLVVNLHLLSGDIHVLSTNSTKIEDLAAGSICTTEAVISGELLNTGEFSFNLVILTPTRPIQRHVKVEKILNIRILAEYNPGSIFSSDRRGVIHLEFPWQHRIENE